MGTRNRQRRAEKLRRRQRASTLRPERPSDNSAARPERPSDTTSLRRLIHAAAGALPTLDPGSYRELLSALAGDSDRVGAEVEVVLGEAVRVLRRRNWDEAEVTRQVERQLGARHAGFAGDVIGRQAGRTGWWAPGAPYLGQWAARERLATVDALAAAIEVLALLLGLPPLPPLGAASPSGSAPGPARRARVGHDPRMLERVRALLAKAESTTFPEEAEALSAKAQQLMARHAIDEAMVAAAGGAGGAGDAPGAMRLPVDDPYAGAKSILLSQVALANRCRAVWSKRLGFSTVVGFESDLEFVEVLYTSLLVQATSAMVAAGSQVDRYGRSRTRSFRQSFLLAYADRIGDRLRAADAASRAAAAEEYGEALLPVLADRTAAVDAAFAEAFPGAVSRSVSINNAAGWAAGSAAADLASLTGRTEVPAGSGRHG